MGVWDSYCIICGAGIRNGLSGKSHFYENEPSAKKIKPQKQYNWLEKLFILTNRNRLVQVSSKDYDESGCFHSNKYSLCVTPANWHDHIINESGNYGLLVHQDCYKFIVNKFKFYLLFGHLARMAEPYTGALKKSKYGDMKKYVGLQDFPQLELHQKKPWLIESPLKN